MRVRESVVLFVLAFLASGPLSIAQEQEKPLRVVTVTVLIDGTIDITNEWPHVDDMLYEACLVFEKEFKIRLKVVKKSQGIWFAPSDNFDGNEELVKLSKIFQRKSDAVVVFTTKNMFAYGGEGLDENFESVSLLKSINGSVDEILGHYVIVKIEKSAAILIHELGHIFGAKHPENIFLDSIMNHHIISNQFDKKNKEVILANRNRNF